MFWEGRYARRVIYPEGSFLASLFSASESVDKVVLQRDTITVYFMGSDGPWTRDQLASGSSIEAFVDGIPDLM